MRVTHMVKLLVELIQLSGLGHHILPHHEGSLNLFVSTLSQELKAVVDQGLVEVESVICQEETSMTGDLCTSLGVEGIQSSKDLVMRQDVGCGIRGTQTLSFHIHALVVGAFRMPQLDNGVLILINFGWRFDQRRFEVSSGSKAWPLTSVVET